VSASRNDHINQFRVAYRAVLAAYVVAVSVILFGVGFYLAKVADAKKLKQPYRVSASFSCGLDSLFYLTHSYVDVVLGGSGWMLQLVEWDSVHNLLLGD